MIFQGSLATDSYPLPHGSPIGQAIVIYNPGLSGGSKDVATKIGYSLQNKGYNVLLAGINSPTASNLTDSDIIVVGANLCWQTIKFSPNLPE